MRPNGLWLVLGALGWLASACAPTFSTPPRLVAVWPPPGASLPVAAHTIELTFNRPLVNDESWAAVWRDEDGSPLPTDGGVVPESAQRLSLRLQRPEPGHYRLHWHVVSVRTRAAADGEQDFSLQDESRSPPRLRVAQAAADAGVKLSLLGVGFEANSAVHVTMGDDEQELASVDTDGEGNFSVEAEVPRGMPLGVQPIAAVDSQGESATAAVQVRWGGWPPLTTTTVGQPGPRPGEVTLSVNLRNRSDYLLEKLRVVLEDPEPSSFVNADPPARREDRATVWEIAALDRGALGPLRATFRAAGPVSGHAWVQFRHRRPRGCGGDECLPAFVSNAASEPSAPVSPAD